MFNIEHYIYLAPWPLLYHCRNHLVNQVLPINIHIHTIYWFLNHGALWPVTAVTFGRFPHYHGPYCYLSIKFPVLVTSQRGLITASKNITFSIERLIFVGLEQSGIKQYTPVLWVNEWLTWPGQVWFIYDANGDQIDTFSCTIGDIN